MLFTSMEFLLLFMPVTFGVYYLIPGKGKNYWLLLASLFFYAWGEPSFVLVMIGSILCNYVCALYLEMARGEKDLQRLVLVLDLVFNLGLLFGFKYLNFFTATLRSAFPQTRRKR